MAYPVKINGVTYEPVPIVRMPLAAGGEDVDFYATNDDTALAADVLGSKIFHSANGEAIGTMTDNGAVDAAIATKAQVINIAEGHHDGNGKVQISADEQAKIIAGNIKSGVTILGQAGSSTVVDTTIASNGATAARILKDYSAYVNGALVTGALNVPSISQDSSTHVLTIL